MSSPQNEPYQTSISFMAISLFLCGALLGRTGHRLVLHLSASWGGLQQRIPLLENVLAYGLPTSPKLHPEPAT